MFWHPHPFELALLFTDGPSLGVRSGLACLIGFLLRPIVQQVQIRLGLWALRTAETFVDGGWLFWGHRW